MQGSCPQGENCCQLQRNKPKSRKATACNDCPVNSSKDISPDIVNGLTYPEGGKDDDAVEATTQSAAKIQENGLCDLNANSLSPGGDFIKEKV